MNFELLPILSPDYANLKKGGFQMAKNSILSQKVFYKHNDELNVLSQSQPKGGMLKWSNWVVLGWSPFKMVSCVRSVSKSAVFYPRWPPLLSIKIEFFMNFELLPILTDYANLKKGGWNLKKSSPLKLLSQSQPNSAEMILGWPERWPPLLKIEIS